MMRSALNQLGAHSESTVMIGDRMDTDVVAGLEAGNADRACPHRHHGPVRGRTVSLYPTAILDSVAQLL